MIHTVRKINEKTGKLNVRMMIVDSYLLTNILSFLVLKIKTEEKKKKNTKKKKKTRKALGSNSNKNLEGGNSYRQVK